LANEKVLQEKEIKLDWTGSEKT